MPTKTPAALPPLLITAKTLTTPSGATISYRQVGSGPGLVYVHGGLSSWADHLDLAQELASCYTVYLPDRRGRGWSSPHGAGFSITTEAADLAALAGATGARLVGGISSGALAVLQACLTTPELFDCAAVYEPPLTVERARYDKMVPRYKEEIARGDIASALITGARFVELGPALMHYTPYWLVRPLVAWAVNAEEGWKRKQREQETAAKESDDENLHGTAQDGEPLASIRNLAPTMLFDFALAMDMSSGPIERFGAIKDVKMLILSGTASRPYLIRACDELEKATGAAHVRLKGLDHLGTGNRAIGGRPDMVAEALKEFFTDRQI